MKKNHEKTAQQLWDELGDIPINDLEEIEEAWHIFRAGTDRYEIWHWFESHFDSSVAEKFFKLR